MANTNSALRITELDFDSIRENLKNYLRSQNEFTDFDFEGSGMSVLLDLLAYNTHYMSYYLNMNANEMFLDTAQLRNSVLSHAKAINYVPKSKSGAESIVNIKVTVEPGEDDNSTLLSLDKYTRLLGSDVDGVNYPFVVMTGNNAIRVNNTFTFPNVTIKQGEAITRQFTMSASNEKRMFEIPSANVDTSTIEVLVFPNSTDSFNEQYVLNEDITTIDSNSKVYFIEENEKLNYSIQFGDGIIGKKPNDGSVISVTYLDTQGELANKINKFLFIDNIGPFSANISVTSTGTSFGGSEKETIEQVRFKAPYFYTTQNRAVIDTDYETLVLKDYPNIDSVSVWGGEENDPIIYGKVFLSLKPKRNYTLTLLEKERIKNELIENRSVMTVFPEIVDPDYVYLLVSGYVTYNPTLTSLSSGQIQQLVYNAVSDYSDDELNTFKSVFRKSKLQNYIEGADNSITGSDIEVYLQKRLTADIDILKNYVFEFNYPIRKGDYNNKVFFAPSIKILDAAGIEREILFEEVLTADTNIRSITVLEGGLNYIDKPTVTITGDGTGAIAEAMISGGKVTEIKLLNQGTNYSQANIFISGGRGAGARAKINLASRYGKLRSYYIKSNGEKETVNPNAGTIDYDNGVITLESLKIKSVPDNALYEKNIITMNAPAENEILNTLRNRILDIDESLASSIQIQVIQENN